MIQKYKNYKPKVHETCFIAEGSVIVGDVSIGENTSIWYNCVIRGDLAEIEIGKNTNIQDGSILHCSGNNKLKIGNNVTIGHRAVLHSCNIADKCLIGIGAIILDGANIPTNCFVGAGTVVGSKLTIPEGSLVIGNPAVVKKKLTDKDISELENNIEKYLELAEEYKSSK